MSLRERLNSGPLRHLNDGPLPVFLFGLAFIAGAFGEVRFVNGSPVWHVHWRNDLSLLRTALTLLPPLLPFAWVLYRIERAEGPTRPWLLLTLLGLGCFLLQLAKTIPEGHGIVGRAEQIVASPLAMSYYTDAVPIQDVRAWLSTFPPPGLALHSATHPPGPILYCLAWVTLVGEQYAPAAIGLSLGALACLGVPLIYWFAGLWNEEVRPRLVAAALYALIPGVVLVFPIFEQLHPLIAMVMFGCWIKALEGARAWACVMGIALFVLLLSAYSLLPGGSFVALYGLYFVRREGWSRDAWLRTLQAAGLALGTCALLLALLWLGTGYDPIQSIVRSAGYWTGKTYALAEGTYGPSLVFNPYEMVLAAGIVALPLFHLQLQRCVRERVWDRPEAPLTVLALLTILLINLTGLFPAETFRLWLFLQPLLLVPAALELSRFGAGARAGVFVLLWAVVCTMKTKLLLFFIL